MQFLDHQVPLDGVKRRAEVHTEDPGEGARGVQVLEEGVQQSGHCVLCAPPGFVGKLKGVQLRDDNWRKQQFLHALHDNGSEGNRTVMVSQSECRKCSILPQRILGRLLHWSWIWVGIRLEFVLSGRPALCCP